MNIPLDCKNYVKYLGILIDSNLSWKIHIEYIALKISKIVGLIAKLRHFVAELRRPKAAKRSPIPILGN